MLIPGTVLGERYRLVRRIGEGGMGSVFEAQHTMVGRRVAIKVLLPECARHPDVVERFEREAKAAGAIGHPGIVGVVDFGRYEELPYMVMEYLEGEDLADRLDRIGALEVQESVWIMGEVLSALAAAHAVGIVHRDLKPENVFLVRRPDGTEAVKVLDFGVSKFGGDEGLGGLGGRSLTKTGVLMGTPTYMAPEQALAKRDVDFRADIYAAGVLLYEMLTNRVPYEAESQAELLMAIVYQKPPPTPIREHRPEIPEALAQVIATAMAPDREQRYQDARTFVDALRPFGATASVDASGAPVMIRSGASAPPPPSRRAGRAASFSDETGQMPKTPTSRSRSGMALGAVAIGVAMLGGAYLAMHKDPAARPRTAVREAVRDPVVHVDIQNVPANATVRVDTVVTADRAFRFQRHSTHSIEVSAPGSAPFQTSFVADRDRSVVIALTALDPAPLSDAAALSDASQAGDAAALSPPTTPATNRPSGGHGGRHHRHNDPDPGQSPPVPQGHPHGNGVLTPTQVF